MDNMKSFFLMCFNCDRKAFFLFKTNISQQCSLPLFAVFALGDWLAHIHKGELNLIRSDNMVCLLSPCTVRSDLGGALQMSFAPLTIRKLQKRETTTFSCKSAKNVFSAFISPGYFANLNQISSQTFKRLLRELPIGAFL